MYSELRVPYVKKLFHCQALVVVVVVTAVVQPIINRYISPSCSVLRITLTMNEKSFNERYLKASDVK